MGSRQPKLLGKTQPRLWTPPLRPLTRSTTLGYDVAEFAEKIGQPFLPWQKWLAVHALELGRDNRLLRFRVILVLVGRQNGKSRVSQVVSLFKLYVMNVGLVLGVAQDQVIARESLQGCLDVIDGSPYLAPELGQVFRGNGREEFRLGAITDSSDEDESFTLAGRGRYKIAAANRKAGRGLAVDHLVMDEIAQLHTPAPWAALSPTTMARANAQIWCITNAGDDQSVVLNRLRDAALSGRDESIGLFEWSAEDGCDLYDPKAWCQANPGLGYIMTPQAIRTSLSASTPEVARTEVLCQKVDSLNAAVSISAWNACADSAASMDELRDGTVAACFDVSPDSQHATLAVAGKTGDGRARVVIAGAWDNTDTARAELPGLLDRIKPAALAWYPGGPGGGFATVLRSRPGSAEVTGTRVAEVCAEFADLVSGQRIIHPGDELLDAQLRAASKLRSADGWRFTRSGGHVDACYAAAGAVVTAIAQPEAPRARIRIIS